MYSKKPKQICSLTWVQYIVVRTGFEPATTSGMGLLTANKIAVSRIQLLAIAFTISPPDYILIIQ